MTVEQRALKFISLYEEVSQIIRTCGMTQNEARKYRALGMLMREVTGRIYKLSPCNKRQVMRDAKILYDAFKTQTVLQQNEKEQENKEVE